MINRRTQHPLIVSNHQGSLRNGVVDGRHLEIFLWVVAMLRTPFEQRNLSFVESVGTLFERTCFTDGGQYRWQKLREEIAFERRRRENYSESRPIS
jgi:hypothetical protein